MGYSALTRRERLERIAMAERDRRAGRIGVAVAALGEATEWPARVVLALAKLPAAEAAETRRILEEGLDDWAREAGLAPFHGVATRRRSQGSMSALDRPIEPNELERAFAEARTQTEEMHSVNHVAEQVLLHESMGFAELDVEPVVPTDEADSLETDAACGPPSASTPRDSMRGTMDLGVSQAQVLATLERWLQNLQGRSARRVR